MTAANRTAKPAGWAELYRSGHFGTMVLLTFGVWLHAADELVVSTVTPAIVAEIGGEAHVAWLTALYEVGAIVAGAGSALAAMAFGLSRALGTAALIYAIGCLVSGFAPSMEWMLAGRQIQGIGGGAMIALAFVAVHRLLPDNLAARGYALLSVVWGVSAFSGPMIGALMLEAGDWRWAFFFYAVQAFGFAFVAFAKLKGAMHPTGETPLMPWRVLLLAAGVIAIAQGGVSASLQSAIVMILLGISLIALFFVLDRQAGANSRLLPLRSCDPRSPEGAVIIMVFFLSAATTAFITYGPLLMTLVHAMEPLQTGMVLLLESVSWSIVAIAFASVSDRWQNASIAGGFLAAMAGIVLHAFSMPYGPVWMIVAGAILLGGGFGAAFAFMTRRATQLASADEKDRVASAIPTTQRLGYAIGAAYSGIVANGSGFSATGKLEAIQHSALMLFGLSLIPAVIGIAAMAKFLRLKAA